MRIVIALVAVASLSGCATWNQMDDKERNLLIGLTLAGLVVGAVASDDDDTFITNEYYSTIEGGDGCHPRPRC